MHTGYGNITPKTRNGRIFVIVYSFFAIPVTVCCLLSYSSIVTNLLKFILTLIEKGCCKQRRVESINLKVFFILMFGLLLEIFLWAYGLSELEDYSYVDALYAWVNTFFTIGFGDNYPQHNKPESNFTNFGLMIFLHVVTLVTIGSLIQSILAMVDSIDNERRNICAILLCCYKNEKRNLYAVYNKDEYGMECAV